MLNQMLSVMHSLNHRMTEGVLTARNGSDFSARFVGASNALTMLPIVVFSPVLNATLLRHSCIASYQSSMQLYMGLIAAEAEAAVQACRQT